MTLSPNTARLLLDLLNAQNLSVSAGRAEIEAVLLAKDELEETLAAGERELNDEGGEADR